MAGLLAEAGYAVTHTDREAADLWLLNSCTVKTPSGMGGGGVNEGWFLLLRLHPHSAARRGHVQQ